MEEKKDLNDNVTKSDLDSEAQKKMQEIEMLINANKNIEITNSKLPYLVVALIVIVILLIIMVKSMDKKVDKSPKNNINIVEIR